MMTKTLRLDSIDLCIFLRIHFRRRNKVSMSVYVYNESLTGNFGAVAFLIFP